MKISVLGSQYIIQVFRPINMLLSCIYTFVYFGSISFLREVINGQHGKKGTAILCASSAEDDRWHWIFSPASLCYYLVITVLLIFLGEGRGTDKGRGLIGWTHPLVCEPSGLVSKTQGGTRTSRAGFLLVPGLPGSPVLFDLGSVR